MAPLAPRDRQILALQTTRSFITTTVVIGGRDKAVKAGECEQQTHQANATRTDFRAHQMDPEHETMQEGQPRSAVKKGHNGRMFVEARLVRPPSLERAAGHLKRLGRLTQGAPLGLQSAIVIEEVRASAAIIMALWMGLDDGSHSDLL